MKIIAINGSHRGDRGLTQILINQLFIGAQRAGAHCETIVLSNKKINLCKGCRVCQTNKSYLQCVFDDKDDIKEILKKIEESDIIIFATPIYVFSMSGLMKIFIERIMASTADSSIRTLSQSGLLFHHINKKIASKPILIVTCQDNIEDKTYQNVVDYFKIYSEFLDAPVIGNLHRKSGQLFLDQSNELYQSKINAVLESYSKAGEELVIYSRIKKETQKRANQNITPIPKLIEFMLSIPFFRKSNFFMMKILSNVTKFSINKRDEDCHTVK
jgi:multimeric flavodoxin WrbA